MRTDVGLVAENKQLRNLVASAGEYFIRRRKGSGADSNDDTFEIAYLDRALPIMLELEKEHAAEVGVPFVPPKRCGQIGQ